ncbi:hypothetical protein AB0D67_30565 [Streptosporangium sp. NPDC048047]|uniref:hypothetical protein n=1 Tax=Streptosporangium sp. NPDC048047 TaxID=3155748 RepID=UPI00342FD813
MISRSPMPPPSQVWKAREAATRAGGVDPCPAGWPRPRHDGLPVPWVTPVDQGRAHWALLHGERLRRCQEEWLCQVCGFPLPEHAYVLADADGELTTSAAMHRRCTLLALTVCPGLPPDLLLAVVSRDDLLGDGVPLDERALSTWKSRSLTPAALVAAATVGSGTANAVTAAAPAGNATEAACGTPSPPAPTAPRPRRGKSVSPLG